MSIPMKAEPKKYGHDYDPNSTVDMLAIDLEQRLSETIFQRSLLDTRMVEDLRQYHGQYDPDVTKALSDEKTPRSRVFVNITRSKADAAEAQMVDLLFPNDDKNWGIKPTPVPELVRQLDDQNPAVINGVQYQDEQGNIIKNSDLAGRELEMAREAAEGMSKEINDQLVEARYNAKCRQMIHDGVVLGTGIIKGPVISGKLNRAYKQMRTPDGSNVFQMLLEETFVPSVEIVRPWDFYPDMSAATVAEAEFVFERRFMTRKQVRELVKRKGYKAEDVRRVLAMTAQETQHSSGAIDDIRRIAGLNDTLNDSRYEVWEYHGPIPNGVLVERGLMDEEDGDPLKEVNGVVVYCGGVVLNVKLNLIDFDSTFPYHVWNWSADESSIFGYGVPRLMRNEQKIMNTAWRAMLDNAAVTAGPQIGIRRKHVEPLDGEWSLKPFKIWSIREGGSMREAMQSMEFNSHQQELANIYEMGRRMVDEVTGIPMIQQGEQGSATPVLGGMSMLMNAANTVRRNQVKMWDDRVTTPLITAFYHFNMEFSDKEDIKGDYQVDARGTSALLVRESLANAIMNLMNITGANPMYGQIIAPKAREILVQWAKTQQLPEHLLPTQEELQQYEEQVRQSQQNQPQEESPAVVAAQAQMQIEQLRIQQQQQKMQFDMQKFEREKQYEAAFKEQEAQVKMQGLQLELQREAMQQETELMRLASNEKINGQKLATELKKIQAKLQADMQKFSTEIDLKVAMPPNGNYGLE